MVDVISLEHYEDNSPSDRTADEDDVPSADARHSAAVRSIVNKCFKKGTQKQIYLAPIRQIWPIEHPSHLLTLGRVLDAMVPPAGDP